jgi:hypothetical protein
VSARDDSLNGMARTDSALRARNELLRAAKKGPTWSLLAGYNAPETIAILWLEFIDAQVIQVSASRLHERVADDLRVLTRLGRNFENTGQGYCAIWVNEGFLERHPNADGTEEVYELTADGHAGLDIASRIITPTNTTTESKMMLVMSAVQQLALATDPNFESRVAYHRAQVAEHEAEIARLEAQDFEPINDARALEGVRDILSQIAQSSTDFARVRRHRIETVNELRRRALDADGSRGDVLDSILTQLDHSSTTEAGRSFDAFYRVIADPVKVTHVEAAIDNLLSRPFSEELTSAEKVALRDMLSDLRQRASDVHRVSDQLAAKLRAYIEENQFAQERRVGALLTDVMRAYTRAAATTSGRATISYELSLSSSEINSVSQWQLPEVDTSVPALIQDNTDYAEANWAELQYMADDGDIDYQALRADIDDTLNSKNGLATIADIVKLHPLSDGLASLVGIIVIGFHGADGASPVASVINGKTETIPWANGRTATIPKVLFRSKEHA